MKKVIFLIFILLLLSMPSIGLAGGLSIGLGYPYVSIKYDFPVMAIEGRFVTESGVKAYSGRGYWNYYSSDQLKGFTGLEGGYINFNTLETKGTGYEGAVFLGGEYFMNKWLSVLLDLAPTYMSLKHDADSSVSVQGFDLVVNIALYVHFGGNTEGDKKNE